MPLPVVRSPLGLPLGGPGLLPGPPALPGCWPEAYIIQYCGSFSNVRTLLDTYTSGAWGGWRPPLVPNKFVSGGPPLDSLSSRDRSEVALHGRGRDGGPPLISELYRCINVFPPCMGGSAPRPRTLHPTVKVRNQLVRASCVRDYVWHGAVLWKGAVLGGWALAVVCPLNHPSAET